MRWNAHEVLGTDFVTRISAMLQNGESLSDDDYAVGDAACEAAYSGVVGTDPGSFVLLFDMFNDWAALDGNDPLGICTLGAADWREYDVVGSLIGLGAAQPELAPAQE